MAAATGDSERLWSLPDARRLAADEEFDAESGYGFSVLGGRAVAVPRAGWSRSGESETLRLGQSLLLGSSEWRLESEFTEDSRVLRVGYDYSLRMSVDLSVKASRREWGGNRPQIGVLAGKEGG